MANASLITDLINIEYLTGFKSSNALLLKTGKKHYVFTDGRYLENAQKIATQGKGRIGNFEVKNLGKDLQKIWGELIKKHRIEGIEFDGDSLTVNQLKQFKKLRKGIKWEEEKSFTAQKRIQKDTSEIRKLKRSQEINEQIFYTIKKYLKKAPTEIEIGQEIKKLCFEYGADDISFEPIVAFGNHSSMPHHQNTERKLKKGEMALIDMGVFYKDYASDMTRMIFTKSPTDRQEKIYNLVLTAQEAAITIMKPGIQCSKLDQIARKNLKNEKYDEYFTHALGHGIGLEVHEPPTLARNVKQKLKEGMVVTSEPGIYLPGEFGVRIEDMILITKNGHLNLTHIPKTIKDCILR